MRTANGRCKDDSAKWNNYCWLVNHMGNERMDTLYEPPTVRDMPTNADGLSVGGQAL